MGFREQIKSEQGERLRALRTHYGLSQEGLAKAIQCDKTTLSFYETGKRLISTDALYAIWEVFGVTPDMMLGIRAVRYSGKIKSLQK